MGRPDTACQRSTTFHPLGTAFHSSPRVAAAAAPTAVTTNCECRSARDARMYAICSYDSTTFSHLHLRHALTCHARPAWAARIPHVHSHLC